MAAYNEQGLLKKNPLLGTTLINPASIDGQTFMKLYTRAVATQAYSRNEFQATLSAEYEEYKGPLAANIHKSRAAILGYQNRIAALDIRISSLAERRVRYQHRADNYAAQQTNYLQQWDHVSSRRRNIIQGYRDIELKAKAAVAKVEGKTAQREEDVKAEQEPMGIEQGIMGRAQDKINARAAEYEIFFGGGGGTKTFSPNVPQETGVSNDG